MSESGHFRAYKERNFNRTTLRLIAISNTIIEEYEAQNLSMTLRQLFYQMVARDVLPNSSASYNQLKGAVSEGRMAGLVSWAAIEDRTRNLQGLQTHSSPAAAFRAARASFRLDLWADQPWRPEVWVEKEALAGVVGDICDRLRVDYFAVRGYNSQSEQWRAGRRFAHYVSKGQRPIVFHLGDHDPSGIDMTRDNRDRLSMFAGTPVIVERLALNFSQIEELRPPPNPAKMTDSRAADYVERYGYQSWELDALSPAYIRDLISSAVRRVRDEAVWDASLLQEAHDMETMDAMIEAMQ